VRGGRPRRGAAGPAGGSYQWYGLTPIVGSLSALVGGLQMRVMSARRRYRAEPWDPPAYRAQCAEVIELAGT
jgi:hypothetical protein